jgi:hypothetical protein
LESPVSALMRHSIINGLMFNISWFIIVSFESALVAVCAAVLHLLIHFAVMGKGYIELKVVLQVALVGVVVDQLLFYFQVFTVAGRAALPPLWLFCLWPVLASTLMHAFSPLQGRYFLAAVAGGVGGVAAFVAGTRLTDVEFASAFWGPAVIAIVWAGLFPLLLQLPRWNVYEQR